MSEDNEIDLTITNRYPIEYLNSLDSPELPTFKLELKVNCHIILLRNIAPKDGLCNGTRLMITRCDTRIIEAQILTGEKFDNLAFIPRISLTPSSSEMPFQITRPYALTINKSQGQSVKFVGVICAYQCLAMSNYMWHCPDVHPLINWTETFMELKRRNITSLLRWGCNKSTG
ncbi:hypothetical protein ACSBR2_035168 [Camellia fascicularis]